MKKIAAILMAGILCSMSTLPIMARNITKEGNYDTTLTYLVDEDYVVTIPESVSLNDTISITSTKANTEPNKAVKVRISKGLTDGKVTLKREYDASYSIQAPVYLNNSNDKVTSDTVIASFADVSADETGGTLTFGEPLSPDQKDVKAGKYKGSITFEIKYETK